MADVRRWVDGTGRVRWQPVTDSGAGRFREPGMGAGWFYHDYATATRRPSLYQSRWLARRMAARRERRVAKSTWRPEVQS